MKSRQMKKPNQCPLFYWNKYICIHIHIYSNPAFGKKYAQKHYHIAFKMFIFKIWCLKKSQPWHYGFFLVPHRLNVQLPIILSDIWGLWGWKKSRQLLSPLHVVKFLFTSVIYKKGSRTGKQTKESNVSINASKETCVANGFQKP